MSNAMYPPGFPDGTQPAQVSTPETSVYAMGLFSREDRRPMTVVLDDGESVTGIPAYLANRYMAFEVGGSSRDIGYDAIESWFWADETEPTSLSVDEQVAAIQALADAEAGGDIASFPIGPLAAYMLESALLQASAAPGLPEAMQATARMVASELRAGMSANAALVAAELDVNGGDDPEVPSQAFLSYHQVLMDLDREREDIGVLRMGPYSAFLTIGLLQMLLRHPWYAEEGSPGHVILSGFARQLQLTFPPDVAAIIEAGFDPANDVDSQGRPVSEAEGHGGPDEGQ